MQIIMSLLSMYQSVTKQLAYLLGVAAIQIVGWMIKEHGVANCLCGTCISYVATLLVLLL